MKNSTGDVETLKKEIETLQEENRVKDEDHAKAIMKIQRESVDTELLTTAKAKNNKAVLGLLEGLDDKLDIETYKLKRNEQIAELLKAEDSKFLFDTETKKTVIKGANPAGNSNSQNGGNVDTSKMTYSELAAYMVENPDAKIECYKLGLKTKEISLQTGVNPVTVCRRVRKFKAFGYIFLDGSNTDMVVDGILRLVTKLWLT